MKKNAFLPAAVIVICAFPSVLCAQTDSCRYDLGHLTLNKAFTQTITIRGEDLEKMPFSNLTDAIRAWLFGAYTVPVALAFVVDGNPVTDVNSYPIYEIEAVTFIDNAAATAAYGNTQKELVLITTKRGKGAGGLRAAAQTGLVRGNEYGTNTGTGLYHQYYLGAYQNLDELSFGVSAGWQRDLEPPEKPLAGNTITPETLQRWRLNGWLEWRPDPRNTIGLTVGYVPQSLKSASAGSAAGYSYYYLDAEYSHLLIPQLSWEGRWWNGFRNKLSAEYLHSPVDQEYQLTNTTNAGGGPIMQTNTTRDREKDDHLVLQDHVSYEATAGSWHIVPGIGLSCQQIDEKGNITETQQGSTASSSVEEKGNLFYITPAVDVSLARALDIGVGMMVNASGKIEAGSGRVFPFVTAALDLLHMNTVTGGNSLKLFGSYARRSTLYLDDYSLIDLSGGAGSQSLFDIYHGTSGYYYVNGSPSTAYFALHEPGYWTWETGTAFTTADGRVTLQYSYERRNFTFVAYTNINEEDYERWASTFHHLDLRFKVVDAKTANWVTGINACLLRSRGDTVTFQSLSGFPSNPVGDIQPAGYSWTGGWVNRLQIGRFLAGLDVVYHLGGNPAWGIPKNTAAVPNIYVGYRFALPDDRRFGLFAGSRGLIMNTPADVADGRRYYTLGASLAL